jgi:hypothetical protein
MRSDHLGNSRLVGLKASTGLAAKEGIEVDPESRTIARRLAAMPGKVEGETVLTRTRFHEISNRAGDSFPPLSSFSTEPAKSP